MDVFATEVPWEVFQLRVLSGWQGGSFLWEWGERGACHQHSTTSCDFLSKTKMMVSLPAFLWSFYGKSKLLVFPSFPLQWFINQARMKQGHSFTRGRKGVQLKQVALSDACFVGETQLKNSRGVWAQWYETKTADDCAAENRSYIIMATNSKPGIKFYAFLRKRLKCWFQA